MSTLESILVVDDDPVQRLLITSALKPFYQIQQADNAEAGLQLARVAIPTIILMDIRLPGITGYEACRQLKNDPELDNIPVIFVSSEITLEDRLAAYDAGGEDFVPMPTVPDELCAKVAITIKNVAARRVLAGNVQEAFQTAMTAMSSASELGGVIAVLRQIFACRVGGAIADCLISYCADLGLDACLQLHTFSGKILRSQRGGLSPVEQGILEKLAGGDRIQTLGRQSAFHYGLLTMLVKNMPIADPDASGRLRDNLAIVAEVGDSRMRALDAETALKNREQTQARLFNKAIEALTEIHQQHEKHQEQTERLLTDMLGQVERAFMGLGLTERQEAAVAELLRVGATHISRIYAEGLNVAAHLENIRAEV